MGASVSAPHLLQHLVVQYSLSGSSITGRPAVPPAPRRTLRSRALDRRVGAANVLTPEVAGGILLAPTPMTSGCVGGPCVCVCVLVVSLFTRTAYAKSRSGKGKQMILVNIGKVICFYIMVSYKLNRRGSYTNYHPRGG